MEVQGAKIQGDIDGVVEETVTMMKMILVSDCWEVGAKFGVAQWIRRPSCCLNLAVKLTQPV